MEPIIPELELFYENETIIRVYPFFLISQEPAAIALGLADAFKIIL